MPTVDDSLFKLYDWIDFYCRLTDPVPGNMPEARVLSVSISVFVDAIHGGIVKYRRSQTGVLIFNNKAPIHWYRKKQPSVETSTSGREFCAMKLGVEMVDDLGYKLRIFGVPLDGADNVFCDNKGVYKNTVMPESTLRKKHHSIAYHKCQEAAADKKIRVAKQGALKNLSDLFTKVLTADRRRFLLDRFTYWWAG